MCNGTIMDKLVSFAIPLMVSGILQLMFNAVDIIVVGRFSGSQALAAVGSTTALINVFTNLFIGVSLGANVLAARFYAAGKAKEMSETVHTSVTLALISGVAMAVVGLVFSRWALEVMGTPADVIDQSTLYMRIYFLGMPFFMLGGALPCIIRADGSPRFAMAATLAGCVINVILDPIAIFVLDMGVKGAAIATALGQIVSAVMCIWYLFHARSFRLTKSDLVLKASVLKKMLPLGISSFLTQISIMVNMTVMNNVLVKYGAMSRYGADIPLSVVGIVQKVFGIMIAVTVGIAAGSQPIVGYNYGAREYGRVKKLYKTMMIAEAIVGLVTTVLVECFPLQLVRLFGEQEPLYNEYAVLAFRVYFSASILCCVQKSTSIFMQALGKPALSMGLSLLRDFVLCVLLALLLPIKLGVYGPLLSAPISDVLSMAAVIGVMLYLKKLLNRTPTEETA